jgi:hypothetical protein
MFGVGFAFVSRILRPEDYWREASPGINVGDVFSHVPFNRMDVPLTILEFDHGDEAAILASLDGGVFFKRFERNCWFLPIVTLERFHDTDKFFDLYDHGEPYGWLPLPPGPTFSSTPSLVCAVRPIVYPPNLDDYLDDLRPIARLTERALREIADLLIERLSDPFDPYEN